MFAIPDQTGRRILVTGANSGLGKAAAARLAAAGAEIVMAVRSTAKGEAAKAEILASAPSARIEVRTLDLASLKAVRAFAQALLEEGKPLDTLVNNAGVMAPPTRNVTVDGHELQFGTNFLGPFALTNLLLPLLLRSERPRVATMTSLVAHAARISWDDPDFVHGYAPYRAYGQSKLADLLMGLELARRAASRGWRLVSTLAHPGYTRTNLQTSGPNLGTNRTGMALWLRLSPSMDAASGVGSLLLAATDPAARGGDYYGPRLMLVGRPRKLRPPRTVKEGEAPRLWALAEELTGTSPP